MMTGNLHPPLRARLKRLLFPWLSGTPAPLWKWIIIVGAIAACAVLIRNNAPYLALGAAEHHEMRILDADEGSTFLAM